MSDSGDGRWNEDEEDEAETDDDEEEEELEEEEEEEEEASETRCEKPVETQWKKEIRNVKW